MLKKESGTLIIILYVRFYGMNHRKSSVKNPFIRIILYYLKRKNIAGHTIGLYMANTIPLMYRGTNV